MITVFGRVLGKNNRLRLAYEEDWSRWWRSFALPCDDAFPSFDQWLTAADDQCLICLGSGEVRYPIDSEFHRYRTGHHPILKERTSHV
jgi:hypothetical protein